MRIILFRCSVHTGEKGFSMISIFQKPKWENEKATHFTVPTASISKNVTIAKYWQKECGQNIQCTVFCSRTEFDFPFLFRSRFSFFSLSLLHQSTLDIRTHRAQSNIPLLADRRGWECLMRFSLTRNFRTARTKIECGKWKKNNNDSDGFQWYVRFQSGSVENNKKYAHSPIFPPIRSQNVRH